MFYYIKLSNNYIYTSHFYVTQVANIKTCHENDKKYKKRMHELRICFSFSHIYIVSLTSIFCEFSLHFASAYTDGRKLNGNVVERLYDIGPRTCERMCSERKVCKTYNYDLQTFVCELNSDKKSGSNDPNFLHDSYSVYNEYNNIQVSTTNHTCIFNT